MFVVIFKEMSVSTPERKKLSKLASERSLINGNAFSDNEDEEFSHLARSELICIIQGLQKKNELLMEQIHNGELPSCIDLLV